MLNLEITAREKVATVFQDPLTSQIPVLNYRTQMSDILYRRNGLSQKEKIDAAISLMNKSRHS